MSFADLGLSDKVLAAVNASGYTTPTPIQSQAIPHVLARKDVLGIAQTGTGKTAAFTLPMLTLLEQGRARARMPRTLILEPTRELAAQVEENFIKYGVNHKLSVALIIGGVSFGDQDAKLTRGVDVLIATPGRLLDHQERGKLLLTGVELLVIDEADRMLDMGFIPDIERICKLVPFTRQTLFFTATMPPEITRISEQFLHNPVRIEVARPSSTSATITQRLIASGSKDYDKREVLRGLINEAVDLKNAIIFCNRKSEVAVLHRSLVRHGFAAVALHGDMDQKSRMSALDSFRKGDMTILVASDVAARGLDIPDVSHVFNYDVPHHAEDYVHRIGRTGRAGRSGASFTLVTRSDEKSVAAIIKLIGQGIEWQGKPASELVESESSDDRGGRAKRSPERRRGRGEKPSSSRHDAARESDKSRASSPYDEDEPAAMPVSSERAPSPAPSRPANSRPSNSRSANSGPANSGPANSAEAKAPSRNRERVDAGGDDGPQVKGMGDHMPAFLMRGTGHTRR
ncbi:MAG: DEAD/DEAH box helicase [Bosea sp. (in: a-proteobacteria)]